MPQSRPAARLLSTLPPKDGRALMEAARDHMAPLSPQRQAEGLAAAHGAAQAQATAEAVGPDGELDAPPGLADTQGRSGRGNHRPATRERGNGRMALTVLRPTLETLGEETPEAIEAAEEAARDRMRRGESSEPGGEEGGEGAKRDPVPLKVT